MADIDIRLLGEDDWQVYRTVRLARTDGPRHVAMHKEDALRKT